MSDLIDPDAYEVGFFEYYLKPLWGFLLFPVTGVVYQQLIETVRYQSPYAPMVYKVRYLKRIKL